MASSNNITLQGVVSSLESRVDKLIADHKRLSSINSDLLEQCNTLKASRSEMQERIVYLEKELALSELKSGMSGTKKSNTRARLYINRLMREVDSCIMLLSSPGGDQ